MRPTPQKKPFNEWFATPKDMIALIIIVTYCLGFLLTVIVPGIHFNELMGRQYERIMLMVVGFYFGSHSTGKKKCPYDESLDLEEEKE